MGETATGAHAVNLNDLLAHYGRVMPAGAVRDVDRAVRSFGARHLRDMAKPPLGPGDAAPDVWLVDKGASIDGSWASDGSVSGGKPALLSTLLASGPVVLKFYRGRWCPYCTLELRAWQRSLERLDRLGARFIAVSPQKRTETESTRLRDGLTMPLVRDPDNNIARQFGIAYTLLAEERRLMRSMGTDLAAVNGPDEARNGGAWTLALPALYVIGQDGRIAYRFVDADYRNRAEPEAVMAAIAALGLSRRVPAPGSSG